MAYRIFTTAAAGILAGMLAAAAAHAPAVMRHGAATGVATDAGTVWITPMADGIFRISSDPARQPGQAGVLAPGRVDARTVLTPEEFVLTTPTTTVHVDRTTGQVAFTDPKGRTLAVAEPPRADGSLVFKTSKRTGLYGAGERGHRLRLNGDSLVMYNRQNYGYTGSDPRISQMGITMPWIASDQGWGLLVDDHSQALMTLGDSITYTSPTNPRPDWWFVNGTGSDLAATTSAYTRLTGRQPLPPVWSLGYITSKYGYHNQAEALGAVDSLRNAGYPLDGLVLDLYWYGVETDMGRLAWNPEQWPDHRAMMQQMQDSGVNIVLITQPYLNKKGAIDNYNLLSEQGMLVKDAAGQTHDVTTWVGDAGMLDVSNPQTRQWLWQRLSALTAEGVDGWWGDLGEPEVHPLTAMHHNGQTAAEYHNVYGNDWSRLIYEGLRRDYPSMRPLLMMRGGTAGLQRYGVMPWTTDVSRSWGGFEPQVNLMVGSGLSGLGYMSSDIGGFAVDTAHPTDEELYVRWLQMGTFTPVLRTHAQDRPEPYHYPAVADITRRFVKMRYEWLPYNYTLAYENASEGWPLARPLNFRGSDPGRGQDALTDEYLWGDNVLVAPVMKKGARSRKVWFPEGEWVDWYNPRSVYKGLAEATVKAPLDRLPLFVRRGSFIPQYTQPISNVGQYDPSRLTVLYFPSTRQTSYTLFDDDRLSPTSLEDGAYRLVDFTGRLDGKKLEISIADNGGSYKGMAAESIYTLKIVDVARDPQNVTVDGSQLPRTSAESNLPGWWLDVQSRSLCVRLSFTGKPLTVTAEL